MSLSENDFADFWLNVETERIYREVTKGMSQEEVDVAVKAAEAEGCFADCECCSKEECPAKESV